MRGGSNAGGFWATIGEAAIRSAMEHAMHGGTRAGTPGVGGVSMGESLGTRAACR